MKFSKGTIKQAIQLREYAEEHIEFRRKDVEVAFGWDVSTVFAVVRRLRLMFAEEGSPVTLPCEPQGEREQYLYRLTGQPTNVVPWAKQRLSDILSRITTDEAVASVVVHATHPNSLEGKKARLVNNRLQHLNAEVEALEEIYG